MAGILLCVIKLLFILLLVLLCLLILALLLLLFAPISYRAKGSLNEEELDGDLRLSWLFGAVSADLHHIHGEAQIGSIRLFGIKLYSIEGISEAEDEG